MTGPRRPPSLTRPSRRHWWWRGPSGTLVAMTDESFARLLVVQDLDTLISQLTHRREMLAERSGLTALEAELKVLAGQNAGLSAQRGCTHGDAEGSRSADRRDQRTQQRDRDADVRRTRFLHP